MILAVFCNLNVQFLCQSLITLSLVVTTEKPSIWSVKESFLTAFVRVGFLTSQLVFPLLRSMSQTLKLPLISFGFWPHPCLSLGAPMKARILPCSSWWRSWLKPKCLFTLDSLLGLMKIGKPSSKMYELTVNNNKVKLALIKRHKYDLFLCNILQWSPVQPEVWLCKIRNLWLDSVSGLRQLISSKRGRSGHEKSIQCAVVINETKKAHKPAFVNFGRQYVYKKLKPRTFHFTKRYRTNSWKPH